MEVGDIVRDRDAKYEACDAVVVQRVDGTADSVQIPATNTTVADENEKYSSDSPVVEVCFINSLDLADSSWWIGAEQHLLETAERYGVESYYYPTERLELLSSEGLVETGYVSNVVGFADPFSYDSGAYSFELYDSSKSHQYSETGIIDDADHITESAAILTAILKSLEWVNDRGEQYGVQVISSDSDAIERVKSNRKISNKLERDIINEIHEIEDSLNKVRYISGQRYQSRTLRNRAVDLYKSNSSDAHSVRVDQVVNDTYLVDGAFSVDLGTRSCTCQSEDVCEHIQYVEESNLNAQ